MCSGAFAGPCREKKSDGLKQTDCQVFLQQRWGYSGSAEKCSSGSATMVSHVEFRHSEGKRALLWGRGRWGLWKTACGCALAAGRASAGKEETSSSSWALPWLQGRRDPILASQVYLRFLLINFLHWVVLAQDRILPGQGAQLDNQNQFSFKKSTCLLYKGPHEKGSCVGNALSQLCEAESLEVKGERELRLQNSSLPCRSQLLMFIIK